MTTASAYREFPARRKDGTPITLLMRDFGDARPAYNDNGQVYEAYQTEWRIDGDAHFVVIEKHQFEGVSAGEIMQIRLTEDLAFLESQGIDVMSIEMPDEK